MSKHSILGGKVHVYKRTGSPKWQCAAFLNGKNHRTTTKTESLSQATEFAEDWYLELRGKHRRGELLNERSFADAARQFAREYEGDHRWRAIAEMGGGPQGQIAAAPPPLLRETRSLPDHRRQGAGLPHPSDDQT